MNEVVLFDKGNDTHAGTGICCTAAVAQRTTDVRPLVGPYRAGQQHLRALHLQRSPLQEIWPSAPNRRTKPRDSDSWVEEPIARSDSESESETTNRQDAMNAKSELGSRGQNLFPAYRPNGAGRRTLQR